MGSDLTSLFDRADVRADVTARCQRDVLAQLARHAASSFGQSEGTLLDELMLRERLGSTGIGRGVAIPHAMADVPSVRGVFFSLKRPVDFDAIDDVPVDLVVMLLAPRGDDAGHLKALSRVARRLRSEEAQRALRNARRDADLYEGLTQIARVAA